eukprot:4114235-Alexandrium_andersonii.AAC.1
MANNRQDAGARQQQRARTTNTARGRHELQDTTTRQQTETIRNWTDKTHLEMTRHNVKSEGTTRHSKDM